MDYLAFISGEFDKAIAEKGSQPDSEAEQQPVIKQVSQTEDSCSHNEVKGDLKFGGICIDCGHDVTVREMAKYR